MGRAPFGHVDSLYCLALKDRGTTAKISIKANYGAVAREILISEFAPRTRDPACAGEFGKRPYYAPNPLRGGATKGGRGLRGLGVKGLRG